MRAKTPMPLHKRLALSGALSVLLVMAASICAFNVFESWHLRSEAEASLDDAIGWEVGDRPLVSRIVNWIELDSSFQPTAFTEPWNVSYASAELELARWCYDNQDVGVISRVDLTNMSCYAEIVPESWDASLGTFLIAYVDVTAQRELIAVVNCVLVAIALVGCCAAAWAGWRMGRRIEASDEARTRFYENMSHELKTPLAAIRGFAEGIEHEVMEPVAASRSIMRESTRMTNLIEQLLDLSRLEAGAVQLHRESIPVADIIQDGLMPFEGIVRTRGLDVELALSDGDISADADLFGHALENVFSNAIRHANSCVCISYDGTRIVVSNDGELPSASDAEHLFDRFFTSAQGGTGIGLAYAREIVELHGWSIKATVGEERFEVVIDLH